MRYGGLVVLGRLFLLFTLVPIAELYLLIGIGKALGALPTVALVLVTGLLGASLARREGTRVLTQWREATLRGEMPKEGVVSSLLVLVGGILLITPGVLTDVVGLSLLFPPTRRLAASMVRKRVQSKFEVHTFGPAIDPAQFMGRARQGDFIDVDATEHEADAETAADEAPRDERQPRMIEVQATTSRTEV